MLLLAIIFLAKRLNSLQTNNLCCMLFVVVLSIIEPVI